MQVVKVLIERDDLDPSVLEEQVRLALQHLSADVQVYVEVQDDEQADEVTDDDEQGESDEEISDPTCPLCGQPLDGAGEGDEEGADEDDTEDYLTAFTGETESDDE